MFKTKLPYIAKVSAESKEAGNSLGPFAEQQMSGGKEFLNRWLSNLRDTNPKKLQDYGQFDPEVDLTVVPDSTEVIPNTGKDPFSTSGLDHLTQFISAYDRSTVVENPVLPGKLTNLIQETAKKVEQYPGAEGTKVS